MNDDFESKHARGPGGKFAPKGGDVSKTAKRIDERSSDKSTKTLTRLKVARTAIAQGGATIDPATGEHVREGYSVATYREHEHVVDIGHGEHGEHDREELAKRLAKEIDQYKAQKAHVFAADPNAKLGLWHDTKQGKFFLDVSSVVHSEAAARSLGLKHDQIAIYDLKNNREIRLGGRLK